VDSKQASVSLEPLAYDQITKTMQSHQTEEAMISMGAMKKQSEKDKIKMLERHNAELKAIQERTWSPISELASPTIEQPAMTLHKKHH